MYSSGRTFSTACFMVRECTPMHLVPPPLAAVTHYPFLCPTTAFTIGAFDHERMEVYRLSLAFAKRANTGGTGDGLRL